MKSVISRVLIVFAAFHSVAAAIPLISVQPSVTSQSVGSAFTLSVNIVDAVDLFAYQFDITFNPARLAATSISEGSFLLTGGSTFFNPGDVDNTTGTILFTGNALIGALSGVTGNGSLATIGFIALTGGDSTVYLANVQLLDSALGPIDFTSASATILSTDTVNNTYPIVIVAQSDEFSTT